MSAGVVAAVAPAVIWEATKETSFDYFLPDNIFKDTPFMMESTSKGIADFETKHYSVDVEITYRDLMFGYDEPDLMWVRPDVFETLDRILKDNRYSQEFHIASV